MSKKGIYVTGMFNNYSLSPEYKMDFNPKNNLYEKAILIKQGFTNYQYQIADEKGNVDAEKAIDGNFWQTENDYSILVYYRENSDRYDRVIGKATANSNVITNQKNIFSKLLNKTHFFVNLPYTKLISTLLLWFPK